MISKVFVRLCTLPGARRFLWKSWYGFLARRFPVEGWNFMNYGYQPPDLPALMQQTAKLIERAGGAGNDGLSLSNQLEHRG